jgi:hypothetical protein
MHDLCYKSTHAVFVVDFKIVFCVSGMIGPLQQFLLDHRKRSGVAVA